MTHELDLSIALVGKKIKDVSLVELTELFRRCMLKVGIRANNLPSKEETAILFAHVIKNYGNHTAHEIDLAFEMAITGKLDIDEKDVTAYENFSCMYLSKILNAYRKWASQTVPHITAKPKELGKPAIEMTDEELLQATLETFKVIKKHELIPVSVYDYLVKENEIVLTDEQKIAIKKQVKALIQMSCTNDASFARDYEKISDKAAHLNAESKKFAVARYFNSLILKGC